MGRLTTYLITGGAGFIGSHLADSLIRTGNKVVVIDNLSTGSMENIQHLKGNANFDYTIADVNDKALIAELVDMSDVVFHLAATVGVKLIIEQPVETIRNNIYATDIILEMASKKKKRVLVASSSEVYGKGLTFPFKEEQDLVLGATIHSRWSYACSKILDEFLALAYYRDRKLPVTIVRLFNTVGPRQTGRYGMVVPNFVRQALLGVPICVFGDGLQTRCFIHVKDVVEALIKISESKKAIGQIINVGSKNEVTIERLAHIVKEVLKSNSPIEYKSYAEAYEEGFEDMLRRIPDTQKLEGMIGVTNQTDLIEIVNDVAEYMKGTL